VFGNEAGVNRMTCVLIYVFISVYAFRLSAEDKQLMGTAETWEFVVVFLRKRRLCKVLVDFILSEFH